MNGVGEGVVTIMSLIVGIAALSVILSPKSQTAQVLHAGASGFVNSLATAMSPVTGASVSINSSYPGSGLGTGSGGPNLDVGSIYNSLNG